MEKVSAFEKFAYSMGAFGQNFVYGVMASYLMIFYTDNLGLTAASVGTLFLVARIWDAVMDPFIGVIVDRTNTKWGKFRPFILVGGILAGIMTIACFFNPDIGMTGKLIYAYATYIIWGTTYGIMDVPYWSMAPSMTVDPDERTRIVSIPKITATIGSVLVSVLTIPMVQAFGRGDSTRGYFQTAVVYGILCAAGAVLAATKTKERIRINKKEKERFRESVDVVIKNIPLLLILLTTLCTSMSMTIKQTVATYYFTYNVKNVDLIPLFALVGLIPMVLAMVIVPPVSKRFGKKPTAIAGGLIGAVSSAAIYFVSGKVPLVFAFNAISMIGIGVMMVLTISMQADTVEYAEWKTGKRSESIIFSLGTFTTKLSSALGGAVTGYWLTMSGYKPNVEQTPSALGGINMMMSWAPAIGLLLMTVIICFYSLTEKNHAQIISELEARRDSRI